MSKHGLEVAVPDEVRGDEAEEAIEPTVEETEAEPVAGEQIEPGIQADGSETPPVEVAETELGAEPFVAGGIDLAGLRALIERGEALVAKLAPATDETADPILFRVAADPPAPTYRINPESIERAMVRAVGERLAPLEKQITAVTGRVF